MDDMREIVTREQVETLFRVAALVGPVVGLGIGSLVARAARIRAAIWRGLAIGLLATLNYGLWRMYLVIADRLGMDTVRNLVVNIVVFAVLGVAGGVLLALLARRGRGSGAPSE